MNSNRFRDLWVRCAAIDDANWRSIYKEIEVRYNESHRFYHSSAHIDYCLKQMDAAPIESSDLGIVELAIWFHDVIFDIGARDNESRSADWFASRARNCLGEDTISQVVQCILSTTHKELPADNYSKYVVDIDLSGLGQDWDGFVHDGGNIRKENRHLDMNDYVAGQIAFMEKLLSREQIYSTEYFNSRLEASARKNLKRQLSIYYN